VISLQFNSTFFCCSTTSKFSFKFFAQIFHVYILTINSCNSCVFFTKFFLFDFNLYGLILLSENRAEEAKLSFARALELDFLPLLKERYDLVIPVEHYDSPLLQPLLETIRSAGFRSKVEQLGGYDASEMGRKLAILGP